MRQQRTRRWCAFNKNCKETAAIVMRIMRTSCKFQNNVHQMTIFIIIINDVFSMRPVVVKLVPKHLSL